MNRTSLVICLAASIVATVGCSSKNYVKEQTTPLINKTNELDDLTAKNTKDIKDVDARAQAGIQAVNAKTDEVEQKTATAAQSAAQAQQMADAANGRVGVLTNTVANLDNYHVRRSGRRQCVHRQSRWQRRDLDELGNRGIRGRNHR